MRQSPEHRDGQELKWLLAIVAIGLALRFAAIATFSHAPESDELGYQSMAVNLLRGNGIVDGLGNRAMMNVGYPLFVLAPVFAFFGENLYAVRAVNAVLGGVAIALCYAIAKEAGAGKAGRLLAAGMWALYLPSSVYTVYLLKENLLTPLMLGTIWFALRLAGKPSYLYALGCGSLFGLLALTGNAALVLAAPAAFALVLGSGTLGRRWRLALLICVSSMLVAGPWVARNMHVLGAPVLNTNGGFNLYLGNNPAATGMFVSIATTPRGDSWEELRKLGEVRASEILRDEAVGWIRGHPSEFVALALKKAVYFWTPPFHEGKGQPSRGETTIRALWAVQYLVIAAGAIGSLLVKRLWSRHVILLWLAIASYTAVHMLFYVIFRYREPVMPLVCVLAALTFERALATLPRKWDGSEVGSS
jgi:4-amino-4-deoxy-L-arabinose transferase-like glycosyltransferase